MFHEMRQVAGKIHMTDDEFLAAFLRGLPTHVSNQILMHRPPAPQIALDIARTLEQSPYLDNNNEQLSGLDLIKKEFAESIKSREAEKSNKELKEMMAEMTKRIGELTVDTQTNNNYARQSPPRNQNQFNRNDNRQNAPFNNNRNRNRNNNGFIPYRQNDNFQRNTNNNWRNPNQFPP